MDSGGCSHHRQQNVNVDVEVNVPAPKIMCSCQRCGGNFPRDESFEAKCKKKLEGRVRFTCMDCIDNINSDGLKQ